jgi:hypothetical protein
VTTPYSLRASQYIPPWHPLGWVAVGGCQYRWVGGEDYRAENIFAPRAYELHSHACMLILVRMRLPQVLQLARRVTAQACAGVLFEHRFCGYESACVTQACSVLSSEALCLKKAPFRGSATLSSLLMCGTALGTDHVRLHQRRDIMQTHPTPTVSRCSSALFHLGLKSNDQG